MPVEQKDPNTNAPLQYYDTRTHPLNDGTLVGQNGFVKLTIQGDTLTLEYRDIDNTQLLVEAFTRTGASSFSYRVVADPGILKKTAGAAKPAMV
jgi:hypothetical protein